MLKYFRATGPDEHQGENQSTWIYFFYRARRKGGAQERWHQNICSDRQGTLHCQLSIFWISIDGKPHLSVQPSSAWCFQHIGLQVPEFSLNSGLHRTMGILVTNQKYTYVTHKLSKVFWQKIPFNLDVQHLTTSLPCPADVTTTSFCWKGSILTPNQLRRLCGWYR